MSKRDHARAAAGAERGSWPVRVYRLGVEPPDDLSASSSAEQRLAMIESLTLEAYALAGRSLPSHSRSESPVVVRRLGE